MNKNYSKFQISVVLLTICAVFIQVMPLRAQDLIQTSDITDNKSVFIFRQASSRQTGLATKNFASRPVAYRLAARRRIGERRALTAKNRTNSNRAVKTNSNTVAKNRIPVSVKNRNAVSKTASSESFAALGEHFLEEKDAPQAIENYRKALALNPNNQKAKIGLSDADTRRADALDVDGEPAAAMPLYLEAIQMDSNNAAAFGGLGDLLDEKGDREGALENYLKALNLDPALADYNTPVGILYYQKGYYAQAETYLGKTLAANPSDAEANYFQGLVKYKENQNDAAEKIFEKNIQADPSKAENYYYLAATDERLNLHDEAVKHYDQALKIDPNYAEAWFDLGVIYYNQAKYPDAANAYKEAIRARADFPAAHANLASALRQMQNYEQANTEYAEAAKTIGDDPDLDSEWGYCLGKVNQWDKAVERVNSAISLTPEAYAYSNLGWVYYNSAQNDFKRNQPDAANAKLQKGKEVLQKATLANGDFEPAFLNLGATFNGLKDYPNAINALKRANELKINWLPALNQLGVAYRGGGDLKAAVEQFSKVTALDKTFAEGFFNLGEAQYRLGNKKEAKKAQETLQTLNPELANKLDNVIQGRIVDATTNRVEQEVQKKNPLKKIPKIPF